MRKRSPATVFGVTLVGFCAFLDMYATQPMLPMFMRAFHASEISVSLTISALVLAVALAAPLVGPIADSVGRKRIIVAANLLVSIPTFAAAHSSTLRALIWWRFAQGLCLPGIFAVAIAYISEEWSDGGAGVAMAAYVTGNVVGGFCGRWFSGLAAQHFGWPSAFIVLGALNLAGGLSVWALLPASTRFAPAESALHSLRALEEHLRNARLLGAFGTGFAVLFSMVAAFTYVTFYLAAPPFGLNTAALGSVFFVYLLGVVITPASGRLIDRLGSRTALTLAMAFSSLGIILTLVPTLWAVVLGLALSSTGVFVAQSSSATYVGQAAHGARAGAAGLYLTFYYVGGACGAAIPAYLWAAGGWAACVALIVAVQMAAILTARLTWRLAR